MKRSWLVVVFLSVINLSSVFAGGISQKDLVGTWTGTFSDDSGSNGAVTLTIVEGANSTRVSRLQGTLAFTTSSCGIISTNFRGSVLGDNTFYLLNDFVGFTSLDFYGEVNLPLSISAFYFAGGCGLRTGTISLTK